MPVVHLKSKHERKVKKAMTKYKLAFVVERYFEFGGLQRNMQRLAFACAQAGHAVTVFTGRWDGADQPALNIQIVNLRALSNHGKIKKLENTVRNLRKRNEFDCIVGFNRMGGLDVYYGGDVCLKAKLECQHRMWMRFLPRYRTYLQLEESVFGPTSDTDILLISPAEADKYRQVYNTASERIHPLPPGIDRNRLTANSLTNDQRKQFRRNLGVQENELVILTVGSSFHTKGIDRTIYAIAVLPQELKNRCRYVVVGLGKEKKYKTFAQKAGIGNQVLFMGGRQDVENFYTAADLLIHPARTENTGNTLLEAMVTGLPVIATGNCGYAHYIQEADGGIVCPEPFVQDRLNTMLYQLLSDDQQRKGYGDNGYRYCQNADLYSRTEKGVQVILSRANRNREH
jgi:UDP-glucose:(heptosyl)LPS alpha-1,3-glucosyltransferase